MWGDHAAAPLNLVRLGYGIGAIIVNLLVRPFLSTEISSNTSTATKVNIFIPYTITATLCMLVALGHLCFYVRVLKMRKDKSKKSQSVNMEVQIDNTAARTNSGNVNGLVEKNRNSFRNEPILSILFITSLFFIFGNEQTFAKFFFTYLKFDRFNISNKAANWGILLFWCAYSVCLLLARKNN